MAVGNWRRMAGGWLDGTVAFSHVQRDGYGVTQS